MKAAIYIITTPANMRLLKKCDSIAEAVRERKTTPCPYEANLIIIDEKFNIINEGFLLEIHKNNELITTEYCEEKGLAEYTAKVLRGMGYEVTIS